MDSAVLEGCAEVSPAALLSSSALASDACTAEDEAEPRGGGVKDAAT